MVKQTLQRSLVLTAVLAFQRLGGLLTSFGKLIHKSRNCGIDGLILSIDGRFWAKAVLGSVTQVVVNVENR